MKSQTYSWSTPDDLFGPFDLDVAASAENTKCSAFYDIESDGLNQPWRGSVWCNPPYKDLIKWVSKAYNEVHGLRRCESACLLLPAQTSTAWFHDLALPYGMIHWIRGKRKFGGAKWNAFMPSVAVVFRRGLE